MATSSGAALAAPASAAPSGLVVAQSAACRVTLVAASYDDPGADDAEFLELRVDMLGTGSLGTPSGKVAADGGMNGECSSDAGTAGDAAAVPGDAGGLALGDCGLGELHLVDGASAGCETYRAIPLSGVVIPPDGYVVLCPAGSSVDSSAHCDVTSAGRSALRAGWLQNGPNDGMRFVDTAGGVALEVGYEEAPACFDGAAASFAAESGGTATSDDVNVVCGGAFTLLQEEEVPLREAVRCPGQDVGGSTGIGVAADGGIDAGRVAGGHREPDAGSDASPWVPERAPAPPPRGTAPAYGPISVDAGVTLLGRPAPGFPRPPACTVALGRRAPSIAMLGFAVCAAFTLRRRRRPSSRAAPPALRASCVARCDSAPRSPSR